MAYGRKTGGRQKGSKNKRTARWHDAVEASREQIVSVLADAFPGDAHAYLMAVYKDTTLDHELRIDAAKTAIRYERAPLAPVPPPSNPEDEAARAQRLHQLLTDMRQTVGSG